MRDPVVSVLMPVRDAEATLRQALDSILRQSLEEFELLAVDDGSCDESLAILAEAARLDPRVRVLDAQGRGLVAALETGRRRARAGLIARMDADDLSHPDRLRLQAGHLQAHRDLAGTGSRVRIFPRGRLRQGWRRYERWVNRLISPEDIHRERFVESPLVHPSVMLRAGVLEAAGGWRDNRWPEDHDLWLRLMADGARLDKVPRILLFWRERDGRLTRVDPRYQPGRFREMKLAHLLAGPLAGGPNGSRPVAIWGAGRNGRRWARALQEAGVEVTGFIDVDPAKIGRKIAGIQVHALARCADPGLGFVLGAVAAPGARVQIRQALLEAGRREERDFLFVQ